jgi:hypothetical protein
LKQSVLVFSKSIFFIGFFFLMNSASAQNLDFYKARIDSSKRVRLVLSSDNRYSVFQKDIVSFLGLKLGLAWKKHEMGIGAVALFSNVIVTVPFDGKAYNGDLRFSYIDLYYEYTYLKRGRWEVDLPMVALGMGRAGVFFDRQVTVDKTERQSLRGGLIFIEPSTIAFYRFLPYTSLGLGAGYRFAFSKEDVVQKAFSAPILLLRLRVDFGTMIKDWKYKRTMKSGL